MKILLIGNILSIHFQRWAKSLKDIGYDVYLATQDKYQGYICDDIKIFNLKYNGRMGYYLNTFELKNIIKGLDPVIVHAHYASGYGTLIRNSHIKPYILSVWGSEVSNNKNTLYMKMVKKNILSAGYVCVTSESIKKDVQSLVGKINLYKVPFGVDTKKFQKKYEKKPDDICIGFGKQIGHLHGVDRLLKVFKRVVNTYKNTTFRKKIKLILIKGNIGSAEIIETSKKLGIYENVFLIDPIDHEKMPLFYNKLDIYLNLSTRESFGVSVLEASSCELPVVASNVGGLPEVVLHERTGYLVDSKDDYKICDHLCTLIESPEVRKELGNRGREFVINNYEWIDSIRIMDNIYCNMKSNLN